MGVGHLQGGDGVPHQLQDLGLKQLLSLTRPVLPDGCTLPPRGARLGAYLESDEQGVWVRQVAPASAAEAAGLRPGDRILELNGVAVQRAGQVIRGVRLHPDGLPLQLTIERNGRRRRLELRLPPSADPRLAARDNGFRTDSWT
jgi:S1-C subfamily serine protease